jgi:hypothetical protein
MIAAGPPPATQQPPETFFLPSKYYREGKNPQTDDHEQVNILSGMARKHKQLFMSMISIHGVALFVLYVLVMIIGASRPGSNTLQNFLFRPF